MADSASDTKASHPSTSTVANGKGMSMPWGAPMRASAAGQSNRYIHTGAWAARASAMRSAGSHMA